MASPFVVTVSSRHTSTITVVAHDAQEAQRSVRRLLEFANLHVGQAAKLTAQRLKGLRLTPEPLADSRRMQIPVRPKPAPREPARVVAFAEIQAAIRGGRMVRHG
jgi:hypothetical protein